MIATTDPAVETWTAALDVTAPRPRRMPLTGKRNTARCLHPGLPLLCDAVCPSCRPDLYAITGAKHRSDRP